mmetsp:Transcript_28955/g.80963  ORF Transcript_28955/g.80963 Transcript_28955/m.80963 type:complete len:1100 (+) Transcript_28955:101-3400(+)|eukprot:CAMPEP_0119151784 /NCGR_PEP_ID=MMETSP1310-20130426/46792_1 /TAXON_ID=464262 /ORGANISM="Genus nov. species nov., Strain RCC2339" /LENGTH=1099 /DNA_ID=CAMNT_0007144091 /DNA_START=56 /DNA_END=3355 /DNA_ORIENTATION=+
MGRLHDLVKGRHLDKLREELARSDVRVDAKDDNGRTALHIAALMGSSLLVRCLLKEGMADVDARDNKGFQPVHMAGYSHSFLAFRELLGYGCQVDGAPIGGVTIHHVVLQNRYFSLGQKRSVLRELAPRVPFQADANGDFPIHVIDYVSPAASLASVLVDLGLDPNVRNSSGDTVLHVAAAQLGSIEAVESLILLPGIDLHARNREGHSAMDVAKARRNVPVFSLLRDSGCKLHSHGEEVFKSFEVVPVKEVPSENTILFALRDYHAPGKNTLTFNRHDRIVFVRKADEHWWVGDHAGRRGVFPKVCVGLAKRGARVRGSAVTVRSPYQAVKSEKGGEEEIDESVLDQILSELASEGDAEWLAHMCEAFAPPHLIAIEVAALMRRGTTTVTSAQLMDFACEVMAYNGPRMEPSQRAAVEKEILGSCPDQQAARERLACVREKARVSVPTVSPPTPVIPKRADVRITDLDAGEVARQICLIDHETAALLQPLEVLHFALADRMVRPGSYSSPLRSLMEGHHRLMLLVVNTLVLAKPKRRHQTYRAWVKVALQLRSMLNFHSMTAVVAGLRHPTTVVLGDLAAHIKPKRKNDFTRLVCLAEDDTALLEATKSAAAQDVPFTPSFPNIVRVLSLEDLLSDSFATPKCANFGKFRRLHEVLHLTLCSQRLKYPFMALRSVRIFLLESAVQSEPNLLARVHPPEHPPASPDEEGDDHPGPLASISNGSSESQSRSVWEHDGGSSPVVSEEKSRGWFHRPTFGKASRKDSRHQQAEEALAKATTPAEVLQVVRTNRMDVNRRHGGEYLLLRAVRESDPAFVKTLVLEFGAHVNIRNHGHGILYYLVFGKGSETVATSPLSEEKRAILDFLLAQGAADFHLRNKTSGLLTVVLNSDDVLSLKVLDKHGIDVTAIPVPQAAVEIRSYFRDEAARDEEREEKERLDRVADAGLHIEHPFRSGEEMKAYLDQTTLSDWLQGSTQQKFAEALEKEDVFSVGVIMDLTDEDIDNMELKVATKRQLTTFRNRLLRLRYDIDKQEGIAPSAPLGVPGPGGVAVVGPDGTAAGSVAGNVAMDGAGGVAAGVGMEMGKIGFEVGKTLLTGLLMFI